ncbi:dihydroneopterin aldolase [Fulvivirga sp. RKSG066]|uniref:dihydroneopterin aldolase n=1 Tax=Fulvivirga aurantia TaxID=2529383 RepID=UPI0012BC3394|nr:dihydroneopterin aldolase [Fulvivirga aurantia]MTI21089.1 dihydroneopterin aldolase [Fulvivirga aurantia]
MQKVALNGLQFKAYHGYYDEEREKGNHFEVDIEVTADFENAAKDDDLEQAVNYEQLYTIIKEEMQIAASLLENVVMRIANRVLQEMPLVQSVLVSLAKLNPPIQGACREARVTIEKKRD